MILVTESKNEHIAVVVNWREFSYSGFYFYMRNLNIDMAGNPYEVVDLYTKERVAVLSKESDYVKIDPLPSHGSRVFIVRQAESNESQIE